MASAEEQQDEPSLGEWIAVYTCRTYFAAGFWRLWLWLCVFVGG